MNLLLVSNLFPSPTEPERGIFTYQIAKRLTKLCNLTVLNPLPWFPNSNLLPTPEKWKKLASVPSYYEFNEIKVFSPKYFLIPKISENYHSELMTLRLQSFVAKLNKSLHFDAINTHWIYPDATSMSKIAHSLSIPHISTGLGSDININLQSPKIKNKIINGLHNDAHITVVSGNLKEKLTEQNIDKSKIDIILNGVDHDLFPILNKNDCRNKLNISQEADSLVISFVGRLSKEKNLYTIIKAINISKKKIPKIHLYIIGDGPERLDLEHLTVQLRLQNNITFVGQVAHNDIHNWMSASDFFCLPSLREGCPNVVLESLSTGTPVIGSTVGSMPDLLKSNNGALFNPQSEIELANSILSVSQKKWDPKTVRKTVEELTWEFAAKKYFSIIENAIVTK